MSTYEAECDKRFYCEDGELKSCVSDCRDCDIYSKWWKEHQVPFV